MTLYKGIFIAWILLVINRSYTVSNVSGILRIWGLFFSCHGFFRCSAILFDIPRGRLALPLKVTYSNECLVYVIKISSYNVSHPNVFEKCTVLSSCHYSHVHSDAGWKYLFRTHQFGQIEIYNHLLRIIIIIIILLI